MDNLDGYVRISKIAKDIGVCERTGSETGSNEVLSAIGHRGGLS